MPSPQDFPLRVETSGIRTLCSLPLAVPLVSYGGKRPIGSAPYPRVQALGLLKRGYIYICSPCATPFVPGYAWYSFKNVAPGGELPEVSDNELMEALFQHVGKAWQRHGMARHGIAMYGEVYRDIAWHGMVCRRLQIGIVRCGIVWHGISRYGMVWHGMEWYGTGPRCMLWGGAEDRREPRCGAVVFETRGPK